MTSIDFMRSLSVMLGLAATLAACSSTKKENAAQSSESTNAQASADTGMQTKMSGMPGMGGALAGMMSGAMMDSMQTHIRMMNGMSGNQMRAALPMHRQMVANMLSQMSSEMRAMNMTSDQRWTATADSVRQDLSRMPDMSASELKTFMPIHCGRISRLMEAHRSMMGKSGQ